jgi:hypothetical protein
MPTKYNGAKVAEIEKCIQALLGVEAEFTDRYDRLQIRGDDRVQSRIDKNNAPKFMVERYANQMGEFTFPPVIVTQDHVTVDGNTRVKARAQRTLYRSAGDSDQLGRGRRCHPAEAAVPQRADQQHEWAPTQR